MTSNEFRKMALEIPKAVERTHMNHPDFRVAGKIFASLSVPDENWGMVKLTPEQQRTFIEKAPEVFRRSSGAWGRAGDTNVYLACAKASHCARRSRRGGKECRIAREENTVDRSSAVGAL